MGKKGLFSPLRIPFNKGRKNEGNRKSQLENNTVIIDADQF